MQDQVMSIIILHQPLTYDKLMVRMHVTGEHECRYSIQGWKCYAASMQGRKIQNVVKEMPVALRHVYHLNFAIHA